MSAVARMLGYGLQTAPLSKEKILKVLEVLNSSKPNASNATQTGARAALARDFTALQVLFLSLEASPFVRQHTAILKDLESCRTAKPQDGGQE